MGAAAAIAVAAPLPSIAIEGDPPVVRVRSAAIDAAGSRDWAAVLRVSVDRPDAPALPGTYRAEPGVLIFSPRYRLQPGLAYRAVFQLGPERLTVTLTVADVAASAAVSHVERVYPTADMWPENQLKFYVHFSAPMSRGEAFHRIHLLNGRGEQMQLPFLEIDEELWDREQRRLTILFDPGRVKRGLVPNQEAGPPLVSGNKYRLVIDREWKDAAGRPLQAAFQKDFSVGPAWRDGIDVRQWKVTAPHTGTREPLRVEFPRPLDAALLLRCLEVEGVTGQASLENAEQRWSFTPDVAWKAGPHAVKVMEILEDLAGNKVGRAFDVDRFERVNKTVSTGSVRITFTPLAAK